MRLSHAQTLMLGFGLTGIGAGCAVLPWRGADSPGQLYARRIVGMMLLGLGLALTGFALVLGSEL